MGIGKKLKEYYYNIIKFFNNIILCIKFPFLYTRNRFSGKHYTNWKLQDKQKEIYNKWWKFAEVNKTLYIKKFGPKCTFLNGEYIQPKYVMKLASFKDRILYWFYKFYENFLSIFHCIPTYTELDHMPKGWRKTFGIQMCKEIAKQLRKEHRLYKYRITDIKEKWGELKWCDSGSSHEIFNIINKYIILSQTTCINCGKPAKWLSYGGWIGPYCDDCKVDGNKYNSIYKENNNELSNMCNIRSSR